VYYRVERFLQSADLTINFKAGSWFRTENHYPSYATFFERQTGADGSVKLKADAFNNPRSRALNDDRATFPSNVAQVTRGHDSSAQYDVRMQPGRGPARGLAPGARGMGDVFAKMSTGELTHVVSGGDAHYEPTNRQFDPKTKQVFAGLNYRRGTRGAATDYGHSHIVLDPKFKRNAMYYMGDTLGVFNPSYRVTGDDQVGYELLGCLVAKLTPRYQSVMLRQLYNGIMTESKGDVGLLIEAHLFEPLTFTGNVRAVHLSERDDDLNSAEWPTIKANARKWATKHGAKLFLV
jgi:hypothetical protein